MTAPAAPPPAAPAAPAAPQTPGPAAAAPAPETPAGGTPPAGETAAGFTVESGTGAAEATSRPGAGSVRHEFLHDATNLLVEGDVVGGDKHVFLIGGTERVRLSKLSPLMAEPVAEAFVPPPQGWDDLRADFGARRTAILREAAGYGKTATAIRLFQAASTQVVYHLDPKVDLTRLAEWLEPDRSGTRPVPPGSGFLCQPAQLDHLHGWVLQSLDAALVAADARLVLTVASDTPLADEDLRDYLLRLPPPPDHASIVRSHLRWRLGDFPADQVLAQPALLALVDELLGTEASRRFAGDLAHVISQEIDGGTPNVARIRTRMAQRTSEDFDIWFGGLADLESRSFAIALAAFNGLPYENVTQAARMLRSRLEPDRPPILAGSLTDLASARTEEFQERRRDRLRALRARTRGGQVRMPYGRVPAEVVEYTDEQHHRLVIRHAWSEYQIQRILLDWLGALVEDAAEQVRVWAATTIGLLATHSFDYVVQAVLAGWATSDQPWRREAVAQALRVPAADPVLRPTVNRLVAAWYADRDRPLAQATAARVYGVSLGRTDPGAAVDALERLAAIDDIRIAASIGDSFADLLADDADRLAPVVLGALLRWLGDRKREAAGQLVFLILADALVTELADGPAPWPTLLFLADRRPDLRTRLVLLWRHVLNAALLHDEAEKVMAVWAGLAEADQALRDAFVGMVRATAAGHERTRRILERCARQWRSPDNLRATPRTADAVAAALDGEKVPA